MGGGNGQFRGWQAEEEFRASFVNGRVYMRRAPGFTVGPNGGTAFTPPANTRIGFETLSGGRTARTRRARVGHHPLFIEVNSTHPQWIPKKRATAGSPLNSGVGDYAFTGTYIGDPAEFWGMEWALANLGTGAILKEFELADRADLVITPTGTNVGTWMQRLRNIPAGINGRNSYSVGFRPVQQYVDPGDGLTEYRSESAWQHFSSRELMVSYTIGAIGQSNSGNWVGNSTGTAHPRVDGLATYTKADPPNLGVGSYSPAPAFWDDTVTFGTGRCPYVYADYVANLLNVPVAVNSLAIAATGAQNVGPNGVNWNYILTHHAFAGNAYDELYLSQGENEFAGDSASWLTNWRDINLPAYRSPAMHGQPSGTVIPVLMAITGRYTGPVGGYSDAAANTVRLAQFELAATVPDVYVAHSYVGIEMADSFHYVTTFGEGYNEVSRRLRLTRDKLFNGGAYDGRGPLPMGLVAVSDTVTDVLFDLNGATSLTARNGLDQTLSADANALTSWQVSVNGFTSNLAISSAVLLSDRVRLTHATATGSRSARNHFGLNPDISSFVAGQYADGTFICAMPLIVPLTV